jgi:hypothetical protein
MKRILYVSGPKHLHCKENMLRGPQAIHWSETVTVLSPIRGRGASQDRERTARV